MMVGPARFELTTFCPPDRRANQAALWPDPRPRVLGHEAQGAVLDRVALGHQIEGEDRDEREPDQAAQIAERPADRPHQRPARGAQERGGIERARVPERVPAARRRPLVGPRLKPAQESPSFLFCL